MSKIKSELTPIEAIKAVNTILIYIVTEHIAFPFSKTDMCEKSVKMHLNFLVKELEKYGDIYKQLCDISTDNFTDIVEAAETIALSFLNGLKEEHIEVINKLLKVITKKEYAFQLAQVKAVLVDVNSNGVKEDRNKLMSERCINALLIFIIAQEMSYNLKDTALYNRNINMHLKHLIKQLEKDTRTFEDLIDFSKKNYTDIVGAVRAIALPIFNGLQAEHYPIVSKSILIITNPQYTLKSAQLNAILINVKNK